MYRRPAALTLDTYDVFCNQQHVGTVEARHVIEAFSLARERYGANAVPICRD